MSKAIASRIAGMRLAGIIAILLVPILLMSTLTLQSMRAKINVAEREIIGVNLASQMMLVAIEIAEGSADAKMIERVIERSEKPALDLGLVDELKALGADITAPTRSDSSKLGQLVGFIKTVGSRSNLLLDEEIETSALALSNVEQLPQLLVRFHGFHWALQDAIASGGIDATEVKLLTYRLGTLAESVERARNSIVQARAASAAKEKYSEAMALVEGIGKGVSVTFDVIASSASGSEWLSLSMIARQNINAADKYKTVRAVWVETAKRLETVLTDRLQTLNRQLLGLVGVASACVLVAILAAVGMFLSTLRRLDHVEAEKRSAEEARIEAETMGARIAAVNEEVTALNKDLAANMQRLRLAQDELLQKGRLEQLGQLTATVAHEIRNPLGSVRTCAFLIGRKIAGKNLGIEPQLERINKGVARCDTIITQLLDFSRTKEVDAKPADLDGWLETTLQEDVASFAAEVQIECILGLDGLEVCFDPQRLRRAVGNLIANSCEAMVGNGTSPVTLQGRSPQVRIETKREGDNVSLTVSDNGPGMTDEVLQRIREPLFTTKNFGTGLGVPAVEQIAVQHGGSLHITSQHGVGATFSIHIPVSKSSKQEAA